MEQLFEHLSKEHAEKEASIRHLKIAMSQLNESSTAKSRVVKYMGHFGYLVDANVPLEESLTLVLESIKTSIPYDVLTQVHERGGMDRVKTFIDRVFEPIAEAAPDHQKNAFDHAADELDSDHELQKLADTLTKFESIAHHYEASDFVHVIEEHISKQERIRKKIEFAKSAVVRERAKKLALKKLSNVPRVKAKARKQAIEMIKEKIARKPIADLTISEKERLEDVLSKRKNLIDRLARKLVPKIRKMEQDRLHKPSISRD